MAGVAVQPRGAEIGIAADHRRQMQMAVVALARAVARRVAVDAARVENDLLGLGEQGARALGLVRDAIEGARGLQILPSVSARRPARPPGCGQRDQGAGRSEDHPSLHVMAPVLVPWHEAARLAAPPGSVRASMGSGPARAAGGPAFAQAVPNSWRLNGSTRTRLPVAANTAFASAGPIGGTPGSPTPVGASVEGTMWTSTLGISAIVSIW